MSNPSNGEQNAQLEPVLLPASSYVATVFSHGSFLGTQATVHLCEKSLPLHFMRSLSQRCIHEACCFLWQEKDRVSAKCFNGNVDVAFCGHGLLACAEVWASQSNQYPHKLTCNGQDYQFYYDDGVWLVASRVTSCPASFNGNHWFNVPPEEASVAGDDQGYWILRWPKGFDLRLLKADFAAIAEESARAVIATSHCHGEKADVTLRYFAPQYGKNEDTATGSAAVILADYWGKEKISLQQCSPKGGLIKARLIGNSVAIGGAVRLESIA